MSRQPALIGCNREPALRSRLLLGAASISLPAVVGVCRMGYGKGEEHCVVAAYARQVKSRSLAGFSRDPIGSAVPQRRQALSAGRRGDGRLPGGERRGAVLLPTGQSQKQLLEVVGPRTMLGLSESMSGER